MTIRAARSSDAEVIADFNGRIARETEGLELDADTVRSGVEALLRDPRKGIYRVAEIDGEVAGQMLITVEWSDWRNAWFWWIQSVYTAPQARGKGVFRALYDHVCAEAEAHDEVCGLRLYVAKENGAAQEAYRKVGMEPSFYVFFSKEF